MSRSYKKNPIVKDSTPSMAKTQANRKVRRSLNRDLGEDSLALKGNEHRKMTQTWDIHDYVLRWPWKDALEFYRNPPQYSTIRERYKTEEEFYIHWKKEYLGK